MVLIWFLIFSLVLSFSNLSQSHISSILYQFSLMYFRCISSISLFLFPFLAQYPDLLRRNQLLDRSRCGSSIPLIRILFYSDHNKHQHWNNRFFFCLPVVKKLSILVMSGLEPLHIRVKPPSPLESCWHILRHWQE